MSLTAEQLAERAKGIGGSDAAAAIGLNPYSSAVDLWTEKRGLVPPFAGNAPTKWGQLLEQVVRQEYADQTGRIVRLPTGLLRHPRYAIAFCHPDGITDDHRLYEGKTARFANGWGEPGSDQIPEQYLIQVQHNLAITALPVADVAVLIGGQDFRLYEVPADPSFQELIFEAEMEFWSYVVAGEPPPVDYESPGVLQVLKKLYPGTNGQTLEAEGDLLVWREAFEAAEVAHKLSEAHSKEAKAHLLDAMGEFAVLRFADGRCLRRALVQRKGYNVAPTEFMDTRWVTATYTKRASTL